MSKGLEKIIILLLRWFLGVVFIYAAIGKIIDPNTFAEQVDNYRLLPWILVIAVAVILPWVELLTALLLLIGRWLAAASLWVIAMNLVFIMAIFSAMVRGLNIDCGCFSLHSQGSQVGLHRVLEDVVFLLAAGLIFYKAKADSQ